MSSRSSESTAEEQSTQSRRHKLPLWLEQQLQLQLRREQQREQQLEQLESQRAKVLTKMAPSSAAVRAKPKPRLRKGDAVVPWIRGKRGAVEKFVRISREALTPPISLDPPQFVSLIKQKVQQMHEKRLEQSKLKAEQRKAESQAVQAKKTDVLERIQSKSSAVSKTPQSAASTYGRLVITQQQQQQQGNNKPSAPTQRRPRVRAKSPEPESDRSGADQQRIYSMKEIMDMMTNKQIKGQHHERIWNAWAPLDQLKAREDFEEKRILEHAVKNAAMTLRRPCDTAPELDRQRTHVNFSKCVVCDEYSVKQINSKVLRRKVEKLAEIPAPAYIADSDDDSECDSEGEIKEDT